MWKAYNHWRGWVEVFDPIVTPTVIGMVGLGATAAAGGISAMSTLAGGDAQRNASVTQAATQRQAGKMQGDAIRQEGDLSETQAQFKARQLDMAASTSRATGQRGMFEKQKATKQALSTLQARAAASGGGATDASVLHLAEDIAGTGEYQALSEMFSGENKARGIEDEAAGLRYSAAAAKTASRTAASAAEWGADSNAAMAEYQGRVAQSNSRLAAASTILSTAGSVGSGYARLGTPMRTT